ncbi:retrovirus polyprotein [Ceratocystis lukuohia]|uniref:Retrovirus polyprotein n=1 Tax=Ceratocystis lukuohia TaxID=2019550 RepID=A0ABR4MA29_9PEZI
MPLPCLTTTPLDPDTTAISQCTVRAFRAQVTKTKGVRVFSASLHDIEKALQTKIYTDPRTSCPSWLLPVISAFDRKKAATLPPSRPGLDTEIRLKPDESTPACSLYSMSREELLVLRKTLYELLDSGFIRASSAEGGAPVIFVKKPGGGIRFCIDYRALNNATEKDGYPLPLIHDTLRDIASAKYVSKVDVISAFHRLRVKEGHEPRTVFRTHLGSFEWLVTPFGLSGAPASFQRFINHVLSQWLGITCSAYLDDVVVYTSGSREDHRKLVCQIFKTLGDAGLQLDWDKSDFESSSIKYLGFIVEPGIGIGADPEKIRAIRE